jgi:hypothetical protein
MLVEHKRLQLINSGLIKLDLDQVAFLGVQLDFRAGHHRRGRANLFYQHNAKGQAQKGLCLDSTTT